MGCGVPPPPPPPPPPPAPPAGEGGSLGSRGGGCGSDGGGVGPPALPFTSLSCLSRWTPLGSVPLCGLNPPAPGPVSPVSCCCLFSALRSRAGRGVVWVGSGLPPPSLAPKTPLLLPLASGVPGCRWEGGLGGSVLPARAPQERPGSLVVRALSWASGGRRVLGPWKEQEQRPPNPPFPGATPPQPLHFGGVKSTPPASARAALG